MDTKDMFKADFGAPTAFYLHNARRFKKNSLLLRRQLRPKTSNKSRRLCVRLEGFSPLKTGYLVMHLVSVKLHERQAPLMREVVLHSSTDMILIKSSHSNLTIERTISAPFLHRPYDFLQSTFFIVVFFRSTSSPDINPCQFVMNSINKFSCSESSSSSATLSQSSNFSCILELNPKHKCSPATTAWRVEDTPTESDRCSPCSFRAACWPVSSSPQSVYMSTSLQILPSSLMSVNSIEYKDGMSTTSTVSVIASPSQRRSIKNSTENILTTDHSNIHSHNKHNNNVNHNIIPFNVSVSYPFKDDGGSVKRPMEMKAPAESRSLSSGTESSPMISSTINHTLLHKSDLQTNVAAVKNPDEMTGASDNEESELATITNTVKITNTQTTVESDMSDYQPIVYFHYVYREQQSKENGGRSREVSRVEKQERVCCPWCDVAAIHSRPVYPAQRYKTGLISEACNTNGICVNSSGERVLGNSNFNSLTEMGSNKAKKSPAGKLNRKVNSLIVEEKDDNDRRNDCSIEGMHHYVAACVNRHPIRCMSVSEPTVSKKGKGRTRKHYLSSMKQQWTDFTFLNISALLCHLRTFHQLFSYEAVCDEKCNLHLIIRRDNSYMIQEHENERSNHNLRKSYIHHDKHARMLLWQQPISFMNIAATMNIYFNNNEIDNKSNNDQLHPIIRQYYYPHIGRPVTLAEYHTKGFARLANTDWEFTYTEEMINDFDDVSFEEKEFMNLWNNYVMKNPPYGQRYVPLLCDDFITEHVDILVEKRMRYSVLMHMLNMWDFGLVHKNDIMNIVLRIDNRERQLRP